eukprot:849969-Pyramimonas_sp.AAC.1
MNAPSPSHAHAHPSHHIPSCHPHPIHSISPASLSHSASQSGGIARALTRTLAGRAEHSDGGTLRRAYTHRERCKGSCA